MRQNSLQLDHATLRVVPRTIRVSIHDKLKWGFSKHRGVAIKWCKSQTQSLSPHHWHWRSRCWAGSPGPSSAQACSHYPPGSGSPWERGLGPVRYQWSSPACCRRCLRSTTESQSVSQCVCGHMQTITQATWTIKVPVLKSEEDV